MDPQELFDLEIARLWAEERVSCPHRTLLQAYLDGRGSIQKGAQEFVAFHVEELGCPACRVEVEDLKASAAAAPPPTAPSPAAPPPPAPSPAAPPPPAGTAKRLLTETQIRERSRGK